MASKSIDEALLAFLGSVGADPRSVITFGPRAKTEPTQEQRDQLMRDLDKAIVDAKPLIRIWIVMVVVAFVVDLIAAFWLRDEPKVLIGSILGGSGLIGWALTEIRKVHGRQLSSRILVALLPNLPPEIWVKVAMVFAEELVKLPKASASRAQVE